MNQTPTLSPIVEQLTAAMDELEADYQANQDSTAAQDAVELLELLLGARALVRRIAYDYESTRDALRRGT